MAQKEVLAWFLKEMLGYSMTAISILSSIGTGRDWILFWLVVLYWAIRATDEGYKFYRRSKDEKKNG